MSLILHAPNIHHGGGKALLLSLLKALETEHDWAAILDARLDAFNLPPAHAAVARVKPTVPQRVAAEFKLRKLATFADSVLCFGNLPPLFKLPSKVFVYLQNRYLLGDVPLDGFPLRTKLRVTAERTWIRTRIDNADTILVQTPSMQQAVARYLAREAIVRPFSGTGQQCVRTTAHNARTRNADARLLYVASGEPHKNHAQLIEAWRLLAMEQICPDLLLTLSESEWAGLVPQIEAASRNKPLKIKNLGVLLPEQLGEVYRAVDGLIFPSTLESFGLPLIEARAAGLPIIASERDYVRDLIDPEESFDPASPLSIARAVKRFVGKEENLCIMPDAGEFLRWLRSESH